MKKKKDNAVWVVNEILSAKGTYFDQKNETLEVFDDYDKAKEFFDKEWEMIQLIYCFENVEIYQYKDLHNLRYQIRNANITSRFASLSLSYKIISTSEQK